jgi:hypothetical protein
MLQSVGGAAFFVKLESLLPELKHAQTMEFPNTNKKIQLLTPREGANYRIKLARRNH